MIQEFLDDIEAEIARISANYLLRNEGPIPPHIGLVLELWATIRDEVSNSARILGQGGDSTGEDDKTGAETPEADTGESGASDGESQKVERLTLYGAFITHCPKCKKRTPFDVHFVDLERFVKFSIDLESFRIVARTGRNAGFQVISAYPEEYYCGECCTKFEIDDFNRAYKWELPTAGSLERSEPANAIHSAKHAKHSIKCPSCGKNKKFEAIWEKPIAGAERLEFNDGGIPTYYGDVWQYVPEKMKCPQCEYLVSTEAFCAGKSEPDDFFEGIKKLDEILAETNATNEKPAEGNEGTGEAKPPEGAISHEIGEGIPASEPGRASKGAKGDDEGAEILPAYSSRCRHCGSENADTGKKIPVETWNGKEMVSDEAIAVLPHSFLTCIECGAVYKQEIPKPATLERLSNKIQTTKTPEAMAVVLSKTFFRYLTEPYQGTTTRESSDMYQRSVFRVCRIINDLFDGRIEFKVPESKTPDRID